jgi:predicted DNA-binding WGR domain protein
MQLLEISHESYCVWTRWGKLETEGQHEASYFVSPELATAAFRSKFFEKTNNKWENRFSFKQFFAKFTYSPEPGLEKQQSFAASVAKIPITALTADAIQQAHKLADLAKAGRWTDLFKMLELNKSLVNVRPEVREFSILHQAVFQGACDVSLRLVDKCGADPAQCTKSGKSAAEVAEEQGYSQIAEKMRERIVKHVSEAGG